MRKKVKPRLTHGEPLPRGRHGLSDSAVRSSQRERLLNAMLQLVLRQGYGATTIPQVVALARVSSNTFYEYFADKEQCFLAACDEVRGTRRRAAASLPEGDWIEAVRSIIGHTLRWCEQHPELAHACFVEMLLVSPKSIDQRERAYRSFEPLCIQLAAVARRENPSLPPLRERIPYFLTTALTEIVAAEIRAGRGAVLSQLSDDLVYLTVKMLADERTAERMAPR